jgi:hypothetical protein
MALLPGGTAVEPAVVALGRRVLVPCRAALPP